MKAIIQVIVDPSDLAESQTPNGRLVHEKRLVVELTGVALHELKSALHDMGINQIWKLVDAAFEDAEKASKPKEPILATPEPPAPTPPTTTPPAEPVVPAEPQPQQPQGEHEDEHADEAGESSG